MNYNKAELCKDCNMPVEKETPSYQTINKHLKLIRQHLSKAFKVMNNTNKIAGRGNFKKALNNLYSDTLKSSETLINLDALAKREFR
tara:strand:- start:55 stop:315 length:261 start_codon:yes stop_codon:yes gene_type:complete